MSDISTSRAHGGTRAMHPLLTGIATVLLLLADCWSTAEAASPHKSIHLRATSGPHTIPVGKTVTLHFTVAGIHLNAQHVGKRAQDDQGHIQLYLDRIPRDAYTKPSLQYWLASVGATTISLRLSKGVVGTTGSQRIIAALACNNNVLYRVPAVTFTFMVR